MGLTGSSEPKIRVSLKGSMESVRTALENMDGKNPLLSAAYRMPWMRACPFCSQTLCPWCEYWQQHCLVLLDISCLWPCSHCLIRKKCVLNYQCDRAHELSWPVASGGLSHHDRLWILTDLSITFRLMNSDSAKHIKACQHLYLNFRFVVLKGIFLFYFLFCYLFKDFRTENRDTCHKTTLGLKFFYNLLLLWELNTE